MDPMGTISGWNDSLQLTGVVPPHGFDSLNRAGVNVTPKTVLSIGVVQRCLEVIQNAHFVMGAPRPYTKAWDKDGFPYQQWITGTDRNYPGLLDHPWGRSRFADNAPIPYNVGCGRTTVSMGLFGEAWWLITSRDPNTGDAAALEPLHPAFVDMGPLDKAPDSIWYGMGATRTESPHGAAFVMAGYASDIQPVTAAILGDDCLSPQNKQAMLKMYEVLIEAQDDAQATPRQESSQRR